MEKFSGRPDMTGLASGADDGRGAVCARKVRTMALSTVQAS